MNKLDKQFQKTATKLRPIQPIDLTPAKPNALKAEKPKPNSLASAKAAKPDTLKKRRRGVQQVKRACFEITPRLESRLNEHMAAEKAAGRKANKSLIIRRALDSFLG